MSHTSRFALANPGAMTAGTLAHAVVHLLATLPAQTPIWSDFFPLSYPPWRSGHSLAYDSARQRTVLFGGGAVQRPNGPLVIFSDTWEWDGQSWIWRHPPLAPPGRYAYAMVYDSLRRRVVLFGGMGARNALADTWEWDGGNWIRRSPATAPSMRAGHAMAFDSVRGRVVLFGGSRGGAGGDETWEYDGTTWAQRYPATIPPKASFHTMAFDAIRWVVVLVVGTTTWEWNGADWSLRNPTQPPSVLHDAAMVYDSTRRRCLLFGAKVAARSAETWEFDGVSWARMAVTRTPNPIYRHAMAYDSARQCCVLYGGLGPFGLELPTWEYRTPGLTLSARPARVSAVGGGMQTFLVNAGADTANELYWILGSLTGTIPGVATPGLHVPLNVDAYTSFTVAAPNGPVLIGFRGQLDANGVATAALRVPPGLPVGLRFHHSCLVLRAATGQPFHASNPVELEVR